MCKICFNFSWIFLIGTWTGESVWWKRKFWMIFLVLRGAILIQISKMQVFSWMNHHRAVRRVDCMILTFDFVLAALVIIPHAGWNRAHSWAVPDNAGWHWCHSHPRHLQHHHELRVYTRPGDGDCCATHHRTSTCTGGGELPLSWGLHWTVVSGVCVCVCMHACVCMCVQWVSMCVCVCVHMHE